MVANNTKNCELKNLRKKVKRLGLLAILMIGFGTTVIILFPIIVNTVLENQFVIKEGNQMTEGWQNVPIPVTTSVYIWNVENPKEFGRGAKPMLREMGPYVYSTHIRKKIISWGPNQESVKYVTYVRWHNDPKRTVGDMNEKITVMNVPAYTAVSVAKNILDKLPLSFVVSPIVFGFINGFFSAHGEGLITKTTPKNLIEGKHLGMAQTVNSLLKPLKWLGIDLPVTNQLKSRLPKNKFGLLYMMNNSKLGPQEIWTGQSDPKKFDHFISFKGKRNLDFYSDPKCNLINGTEGITFGSFLKKEDVLYVFNGDSCRSLYATYKEQSHVRGIPTWRYRMPPSLFASPDKNPSNKCFCTTLENYQKCDGIFDMGQCQMGAPLAISFPHLLYASNLIQSGVEGVNPDPDQHEAYFDINPILGIPISGKIRLQINLLVKPMPSLNSFRRIRETVLPFVWLEISVGVNGMYEWLMRFATYALLIGLYGPYLAFFGGFAVLGYTLYLIIKERRLLFSTKSESTSLETIQVIDKQMDEKTKYLYDNIFSIVGNEDSIKANPLLYNIKQNNREKRFGNGRTFSLNGTLPNLKQGRALFSPPGTIE